MTGDRASIQVYEETSGLGPGAEVETTGFPMSVELGPGMIENIYDGIQRPLEEIKKKAGSNLLPRGVEVPPIDPEKLWDFTPTAQAGDQVVGGDVIGTVPETPSVLHKIMVPPNLKGTLKRVGPRRGVSREADHRGAHPGGRHRRGADHEPALAGAGGPPLQAQISPRPAPVLRAADRGHLLPVAKGGTAAIPGPFGSGKTVMQHALAKWSDVDIVVYIGCGERGNEMTDVLREFPELVDPRTGQSLMKRTVLIANTSDMPVAAREASSTPASPSPSTSGIWGTTWRSLPTPPPAGRRPCGRCLAGWRRCPARRAIPPTLSSRLAQFYERAGSVECLGSGERRGSLTAVGAVSPPRRRPERAGEPGHHAHCEGCSGPWTPSWPISGISRPSTGSIPTPVSGLPEALV